MSIRAFNRVLVAIVPLALVLLLSLSAEIAQGQVDTFEFDTPEQQQRFRRLSDEFRCPMCQNTSLSGSTGGVAEDLRREVHRMIVEGLTDAEIEQFMFERYGDFIFYKPRLTRETLLLWFGPLLFLGLGGFVVVRIWRNAQNNAPEIGELDDAEQRRLERLAVETTRLKDRS
ncbi:MAG: cytochrome c-type biogenesis protein CcmH [Gammaproteobacteria bacterium]|nr:cytochrome c-type biogenesis protein CcmH [Gammaproteobacteria bacterium]